MDKMTIRKSRSKRAKKKDHQPLTCMVTNNGLDKSDNKMICGITTGKPRMAIMAELPPALPAMAANVVNKSDKLIPPVNTINRNF